MMNKLPLLILACGTLAFAASPAKADFVTYPAGCYVCTEHPSLIGYYEDCTSVSDGQNGDGIYCKEMQSLLVRYCATSGGACYYIETGGGGGGRGGTGSGGSVCVTSGGQCPPDCFSCGELY
jgi:hypothetical protein